MMNPFLRRHWFLVALGICFMVGFTAAGSLGWLHEQAWLRNTIVFAVMGATGITLHAEAIRRSVARPIPASLAVAINILLVPALAWLAGAVIPESLLPARLWGGLYIAALVPCTLASAAVWTRKAGGDDSIALLTTVVTNLACVVVVPIGVALALSRQTGISAIDQMLKLAIFVVTPLLLAQAIRRLGGSAWADRNKVPLTTASQIGILAMVFFGAIASSRMIRQAPAETVASAVGIPVVVLAGIFVHLAALAVGIAAARRLGAERNAQIAVGIAGSQKTLMVGLQIAIDCGVSILPMIAYHLGQLFLDTLIAERWKRTP